MPEGNCQSIFKLSFSDIALYFKQMKGFKVGHFEEYRVNEGFYYLWGSAL